MFLLFAHINIVPETQTWHHAGPVGVVVSPVVLVPGDELLQTALHDAGDPIRLADVAHELDRKRREPGDQADHQYEDHPHFHVVPFTQPSNH